MTFGFPKTSRIRHRRDFQTTMDQGAKTVCPHVVLYGRARAAGDAAIGRQEVGPRLGLVVSRKVGESVVRNRVKRRLRESFRAIRPALANDANLQAVDVVVVARASAAKLDSQQLSEALINCLRRLGRQLERRPRSSSNNPPDSASGDRSSS